MSYFALASGSAGADCARGPAWAAPLLVLSLALGLAAPARAQPTEAPPHFPVQQVELVENSELFTHGKAAIYHGEVGAQGHGFALAGLSMLQPVAVTLLADQGAPVTMTIGKEWALAERKATGTARQGAGGRRSSAPHRPRAGVGSPRGLAAPRGGHD